MMELLTLDDNFQPVRMIENYQSLIWTERYSSAGDFELKTGAIEETMRYIPLESFVTLRESTVPMIAEVYKIEKPKGEAPTLTITGRSFETVLERRAMLRNPYGAAEGKWLLDAPDHINAIYRAMRDVVGDIIHYDGVELIIPATEPWVFEDGLIRQDLTRMAIFPPPADYGFPAAWSSTTDYDIGAKVTYNEGPDGIPISWVANAGIPAGGMAPPDNTNWTRILIEIPSGNLYGTVMEQLALGYRGLKTTRPGPDDNVVSIEIYNGADRRSLYSIDARFDQFDDTTYLLSEQGSVNVAYVDGPPVDGISMSAAVNKTTTTPVGLKRRVMYLDLTQENAPNLTDRALIEMYKYNATAIFDGTIAENVASGYNREYFLGDIIKLVGEYGLYRNVRVSEFIRSSDNQGSRAYPALEVVEE